MTKRYKRAILIGRFEPLHNGHFANIQQAAEIADRVIVLIGSSYQPRTPKNPFTAAERHSMILEAVSSLGDRLSEGVSIGVSYLRDFKYSNNHWIADVQRIVKQDNPDVDDKDIAILGYDKDETSWYNHAFPEWDFIPLNGFVAFGSVPIDATKVRELYFEGHLDFIRGAIPESTFDFLTKFRKTQSYADMVEEYDFYKGYIKDWECAPHPPIFQTADAVVIQGGHVLLIQRKFAPGRGLWALPGGFIKPKERLFDAAIRELTEEVKVKVPEIVLRKGITYNERFDHPDRDLRGRMITEAYLIELTGGNGKLPRVKAADDAKKAKWFKLSDIKEMGEIIYADHQHIIETMVAHAKG